MAHEIKTNKVTSLDGQVQISPEAGNSLVVSIDGDMQCEQIVTPANPPTGYTSLYFKSDNVLYQKTTAGVESAVGGGGSSGIVVDSTGISGGTSGAVPYHKSDNTFGETNLRYQTVDGALALAGFFALDSANPSTSPLWAYNATDQAELVLKGHSHQINFKDNGSGNIAISADGTTFAVAGIKTYNSTGDTEVMAGGFIPHDVPNTQDLGSYTVGGTAMTFPWRNVYSKGIGLGYGNDATPTIASGTIQTKTGTHINLRSGPDSAPIEINETLSSSNSGIFSRTPNPLVDPHYFKLGINDDGGSGFVEMITMGYDGTNRNIDFAGGSATLGGGVDYGVQFDGTVYSIPRIMVDGLAIGYTNGATLPTVAVGTINVQTGTNLGVVSDNFIVDQSTGNTTLDGGAGTTGPTIKIKNSRSPNGVVRDLDFSGNSVVTTLDGDYHSYKVGSSEVFRAAVMGVKLANGFGAVGSTGNAADVNYSGGKHLVRFNGDIGFGTDNTNDFGISNNFGGDNLRPRIIVSKSAIAVGATYSDAAAMIAAPGMYSAKYYSKETGSNDASGTATLSSGTVTVTTTAATGTGSAYRLFVQDTGTGFTNVGTLKVDKSVSGQFTVNSSNILDASTIDWFIVRTY